MIKGIEFERLIEDIYKKLDPDSSLTRNEKLHGHDSHQYREINLVIRDNVGIHNILIIIQAKDLNKPA